MRTFILAALVISMAAPMIMADPNAQTGSQTGSFWSEATSVSVQGGTGFALLGAPGDHDIMFLDANGNAVGFFLACGPEVGDTVPASAVTADILIWDHIGGVVPQCLVSDTTAPSSQWVYVDGL